MKKTALEYFHEISRIPRPSGYMEPIRAYVKVFAKDRGLVCEEDDAGNIVIRRPASPGYENTGCLMLQGHLDMVEARSDTSVHDFKKDSLTLITEGDILTADGTTLGADDGVAVAYMLALLDDADILAPELECVFTVDEEIGLVGADKMDCSKIRSKYMINLDSPNEGIFTVACAGGKRYNLSLDTKPVMRRGVVFMIILNGLKGGHSGEDAHKGRASSNVLMNEILSELDSDGSFCLYSFDGGSQDNAIPSSSAAELQLPLDNFGTTHVTGDVETEIERMKEEFKNRYQTTDPDLELLVNVHPEINDYVLNEEDTAKILGFIKELPAGAIKMSEDVPGLVQTSANIGIIRISPEKTRVVVHLRSSDPDDMASMSEIIEHLSADSGFICEVSSEYPGWQFEKESRFRDKTVEIYEKMYGQKPELEIIHAGLECGIFKEKVPKLDIISIGPNVWDLHSYNETMSISSFNRVYEYICQLLLSMDNESGL